MQYTQDHLAEIELLMLYDLASTQSGIKIHSDARPEAVAAAKSLYAKGFITLEDGGYLTDLGLDAAQHAQTLYQLLTA